MIGSLDFDEVLTLIEKNARPERFSGLPGRLHPPISLKDTTAFVHDPNSILFSKAQIVR